MKPKILATRFIALSEEFLQTMNDPKKRNRSIELFKQLFDLENKETKQRFVGIKKSFVEEKFIIELHQLSPQLEVIDRQEVSFKIRTLAYAYRIDIYPESNTKMRRDSDSPVQEANLKKMSFIMDHAAKVFQMDPDDRVVTNVSEIKSEIQNLINEKIAIKDPYFTRIKPLLDKKNTRYLENIAKNNLGKIILFKDWKVVNLTTRDLVFTVVSTAKRWNTTEMHKEEIVIGLQKIENDVRWFLA